MHIGNDNINFPYNITGHIISKATEQRDLGVLVSDNLKFSRQCVEASKTANRILGFISRTFEHKNKDIVLPLYKSLVRPHLEYAVQFWNPYKVEDIKILERVQRRATKMIAALKNKPYNVRLQSLGFQTLEVRRLRGQLIEVFKILNNFDKVDDIIVRNESERPRNNGYKLKGKRFRTDIAKNFFANKIINVWNILPVSIVTAGTINEFKNKLDKHFASDSFAGIARICEFKIT